MVRLFKKRDPLDQLLLTPEQQVIFEVGRLAGCTHDLRRPPRHGAVWCPSCGRATEHRWSIPELRLFCTSCGRRNYKPVVATEVMCCRRGVKAAGGGTLDNG